MRVVGFIGPSGTGKSYRAIWVARERGLEYIIDDGLLIHGNKIVAGKSAKREPTKVGSVKAALFVNEVHCQNVRKAIMRVNPEGIMILGTSEGMVQKIAAQLNIGEINERVYIHEVASEFEMQEALKTRRSEGKHVIPVPSFEVKRDFSGFLIDPLQIFRRKGKGDFQHIGEKTVVRPTFSYLGKYTISDYTIFQIMNQVAQDLEGIRKISRYRLMNTSEGLFLEVDLVMVLGYNIQETLKILQREAKKEIEYLTALNVRVMNVYAKSIVLK